MWGRPMDEPPARIARRDLITRGSGAALGAAVVWSAPSVRTIALRAGAAGTPPPGSPAAHSTSNSANGAATDPGASDAVGASSGSGSGSGTLPLTGIDPRPLLMAGGTAIVAGGALVAIAHDPEPARGDS